MLPERSWTMIRCRYPLSVTALPLGLGLAVRAGVPLGEAPPGVVSLSRACGVHRPVVAPLVLRIGSVSAWHAFRLTRRRAVAVAVMPGPQAPE
jgi:hypothetical protein